MMDTPCKMACTASVQGGHTLHGGEDAAALPPGGQPFDARSHQALHLAQHSRVRIVLQQQAATSPVPSK